MTDQLQAASAWLAGVLKSRVAQTVTLKRGATRATTGVAATVGRSEFEEADADGVAVRIETRDFLIQAADYQIGGAAVRPQRGDRIVQTDAAGAAHAYVASAPAPNPVWRWSDPYHTTYRVHAVEDG